ncbi:MAG: hypothetical protein AAF547_23015 [Actinomycetota bacterium]
MTNENHRSDDHELLRRLTAADPAAGNPLPSAFDPRAQEILEYAMSTDTPDLAGTPAPTGPPTIPTNGPITIPSAVERATGSGIEMIDAKPAAITGRPRGRGLLLASAAAVLLLIGGLLVFLPENTPSAVATVHSAAAAAADADTGRIETTVAVTGTDGVESGTIDASFLAAYAGDDLSVTVDLAAGGAAAEEFDALAMAQELANELVLVDDVVYINLDGQWLSVDTDGLLGQMVTDIVDPRSVLETVQGLTEATEVGSATIDGVDTTHFQSVIDLADESLNATGWLGFEGAPIDTEGEVTVDLYVDDAGLLRQMDLSGDVQDTGAGGENGTFEVSTRFFDIGADITVEAPADAQPFDPMADLFDN